MSMSELRKVGMSAFQAGRGARKEEGIELSQRERDRVKGRETSGESQRSPEMALGSRIVGDASRATQNSRNEDRAKAKNAMAHRR